MPLAAVRFFLFEFTILVSNLEYSWRIKGRYSLIERIVLSTDIRGNSDNEAHSFMCVFRPLGLRPTAFSLSHKQWVVLTF